MWRVGERRDPSHYAADFTRETDAKDYFNTIIHNDIHIGDPYVWPTEGRYESPHPWRIWVMDPHTGLPTSMVAAFASREMADWFMQHYRPVAQVWRLFHLESNGDQITADHPDAPVKPVSPEPATECVAESAKPRRRAIRL